MKNKTKKMRQSLAARAQTAIEYVMMISAAVMIISITAFFIKTRVIAP